MLLTKVGPLAKESIAGLALTLLLCHQGIDSDELWKRRSVRRELTVKIYPLGYLVQRCDSDMDFEALLIHTRQEVALDLKSFMFSIFQFVKHFAPTF